MPTTKPRLSINLSNSEHAELSALADKHNLSMAWIGRKAVTEFLERHRDNPLQLPLTFTERAERPEWLDNNGPR